MSGFAWIQNFFCERYKENQWRDPLRLQRPCVRIASGVPGNHAVSQETAGFCDFTAANQRVSRRPDTSGLVQVCGKLGFHIADVRGDFLGEMRKHIRK